MTRPLVLFVILGFSPTVCDGQDLQTEVRQLMSTKYRDVATRAEQLARDRRFGEAHKLWLSAVADDEKTAADLFLLGNVLFEAQPKKALELHQRAAKLEPKAADIQLELGMCLHKAGKYREAVAAYTAYTDSSTAKARGPGVFDALLADCLIRTGKYKAACDAWERVPFRSYRIKIAHYACKIHGKTTPFQRHYDLLTRARQKDIEAAMQLILLDCDWNWDWWTVEVNRDFLKADATEVAKLFPAGDTRVRLMQAIAAYHLSESPDVEQFATALKNDNLIVGDQAVLPDHGLLVSHATRLVLENKLSTAAKLLDIHQSRFEAEIVKPASEIDIELVNVYASLLAQSDRSEKLSQVDRIIWQKTDAPRFAASYLVSLVRNGKDTANAEVKSILSKHSEQRVVSGIALSFAQENEQPLTKPIAVAIAAEFKSLTPNPLSGIRTSDRLNVLFKALRQSLQNGQLTKP